MIAVVAFILIAVLFFKPFSPDYVCSNGVCLSAYMEPDAVSLKGGSTLWVDLLNKGNTDLVIDVRLKTRNQAVLVKETGNQEISREIELGAGERMMLDFVMKANATYPGTYRTDVVVRYGSLEIADDVYLKVS